MKFLKLLLAVFVTTVVAKKVRYDGHHLFWVYPSNAAQAEHLSRLREDFQLDFWTELSLSRPVHIRIRPEIIEEMVQSFEENGIKYEIAHKNIQRLINFEAESSARRRGRQKRSGDICSRIVDREFAGNEDIRSCLESYADSKPSYVNVENIGQSYEGRVMTVITISDDRDNKPAIWVDAGIHAREWLAPATAMHIIDQLVDDYETDEVLRKFTWHVLPVANPDGYEYSHTNDRLWRKTRSPTFRNRCIGVDPNRNWDHLWNTEGVSDNPCDQTYPGTRAFSEKCTSNMKDFILREKGKLKLYFSIHSYSELWLTPWGGTRTRPDDYNELTRVADIGASALYSVHKKRFQVGTPPDILYAASGGSYDWAKAEAGIKYSYTLELRPGGNSWNGFVVDKSVIPLSGEEVFQGLKATANEIPLN